MPSTDQENTIVIGETRYSVHQLSVAQRIVYWEFVDELAKKHVNPWEDLHEKTGRLPLRLQEIIFVGAPKSLFPLTRRQKTETCCRTAAILKLLDLSLVVAADHSDQGNELCFDLSDEIVKMDRVELLQVFLDLIGVLGESYAPKAKSEAVETHHQGDDAIDFLRGTIAEAAKAKAKASQSAEISAAGRDPEGTEGEDEKTSKAFEHIAGKAVMEIVNAKTQGEVKKDGE